MFEVGDSVETVTDDDFDGQLGVVVQVPEIESGKGAQVQLDTDAGHAPLWFYFSELRKVEG